MPLTLSRQVLSTGHTTRLRREARRGVPRKGCALTVLQEQMDSQPRTSAQLSHDGSALLGWSFRGFEHPPWLSIVFMTEEIQLVSSRVTYGTLFIWVSDALGLQVPSKFFCHTCLFRILMRSGIFLHQTIFIGVRITNGRRTLQKSHRTSWATGTTVVLWGTGIKALLLAISWSGWCIYWVNPKLLETLKDWSYNVWLLRIEWMLCSASSIAGALS